VAAWVWRGVIMAGLALALAGAARMLRLQPVPPWSVALLAVMLFAAAVCALIGLSFLRARIANRGTPQPAAQPRPGRAFLTELAAFPGAVLAMCGGEGRAAPRAPERQGPGARPVLLLHGVLCNGRVWGALRRRLSIEGYGPIETPDIEPLLGDLDHQARAVEPTLRALQARGSGAGVLIVAHSMGGLVARALLRDVGSQAIRGIITVATPHHGTVFARGLPGRATRQLARGSPWLGALNAAQEGRFGVPVTSIFSSDDNLVAPAESARIDGADNRVLSGVGHLGMLSSGSALDGIMAAVARAWSL
jgi:pimeloyl-ACP methyl ester carboxylesterase